MTTVLFFILLIVPASSTDVNQYEHILNIQRYNLQLQHLINEDDGEWTVEEKQVLDYFRSEFGPDYGYGLKIIQTTEGLNRIIVGRYKEGPPSRVLISPYASDYTGRGYATEESNPASVLAHEIAHHIQSMGSLDERPIMNLGDEVDGRKPLEVEADIIGNIIQEKAGLKPDPLRDSLRGCNGEIDTFEIREQYKHMLRDQRSLYTASRFPL